MQVRCEKCRHRIDVCIPANAQEMHFVCAYCGTPFVWVRPAGNGDLFGEPVLPKYEDDATEANAELHPDIHIPQPPSHDLDTPPSKEGKLAPKVVQMYRCATCGRVFDMDLHACPHCGQSVSGEAPCAPADALPQGAAVLPPQEEEPITIINSPDAPFAPVVETATSPQGERSGARECEAGKRRSRAALLAFFLGGLGVHHFYLGNIYMGVAYLLLCWTFIPSLVSFFESLHFMFCSQRSFDIRYNAHHVHH